MSGDAICERCGRWYYAVNGRFERAQSYAKKFGQ